MQAVRIHKFGGSEQVKVEESPIPATTRGQALVRVRAASVNPVDWMVREHEYNPKGMDRTPLTLGQDFAGVIEAIAPGTRTTLREGDEVFGEAWGTFAEYAAVPVKDLVRKPKAVDFVVAASLPMPGLTAWQVINDTARASRNKTFLIHGASGGVGSFAAQFAKYRGARVIATARRQSAPFLRGVGVDQVIDYKAERFDKMVNDIDVVVDPIGGETQARSWSVLKAGGMLINLVGEIDRQAARRARVRGIDFGMEYDVGDLRQIARLVARGTIRPHISKVLPMRQARRALDMSQHGRSHGKIVLRVH